MKDSIFKRKTSDSFFITFIDSVENGQNSVDDLTTHWHSNYLRLAIEHQKMKFIELFLEHYNVPSDLTLQQRLSMFFLLGEVK